MLTFLRKIRKSLINFGSARKYLLYALGEIGLVVIGILMALQINNWNEGQKQKRTIHTYLQSLKENLAEDTVSYRGSINKDLFRYYSLQYLLKVADQTKYDPEVGGWQELPAWDRAWMWQSPIPKEYDREFIEKAFIWSYRYRSAILKTSTIEEMKSTGQYSYIKNKNLKEEISGYYADYENRFGIQEQMKPIEEDWIQSLLEEGILPYAIDNLDNIEFLFQDNKKRVAILKGSLGVHT